MFADASVWLFQFIKAMRDERGELIKNAHLLGFFRRICRRREQQDTKLRKTAEKLLLNQLKQHALEQVQQVRGGPQHVRGGSATGGRGTKRKRQGKQQVVEDLGTEVAAAARQTEPGQHSTEAAQPDASHASAGAVAANICGAAPTAAGSADDEMPGTSASHAAHGAARRSAPGVGNEGARMGSAAVVTSVDELLAAQLHAEGLDNLRASGEGAATTAVGEVVDLGGASEGVEGGEEYEEEEEGEEELALEMMVPEDGELDPEVLSTLPPSLQLDIIMRVREQRVTLNREKFEARSGVPASFSDFQLQQYLKASALRRQVEQVRSAVNAAVAGGEASRRIAAEAGREYVLQKDQPAGSQLRQPQGPQQQQQQQQTAGQQQGPAAAQAVSIALQAEDLAPLDISFELPEMTQIGGDGVGRDVSDDLEWEDVGGETDGAAAAAPSEANDAADLRKRHWRERAAQRQRFWSLSHGFQRGRALADWGKEDEPAGRGEHGRDGTAEVREDDEEFQRAIQLSLEEQRQPQQSQEEQLSPERSEGEEIWEEVWPEEGAHLARLPAQHPQHLPQQHQQHVPNPGPGQQHQQHLPSMAQGEPQGRHSAPPQQARQREQIEWGQGGTEQRPLPTSAQPAPQAALVPVPMAITLLAQVTGMPTGAAIAKVPALHPAEQPIAVNAQLLSEPSAAVAGLVASRQVVSEGKIAAAAAATYSSSRGASDSAAAQHLGAGSDTAQAAPFTAAKSNATPSSAGSGGLLTTGVTGTTGFHEGPSAVGVAVPTNLAASGGGPATERAGLAMPLPPGDLAVVSQEQPLVQPAQQLPPLRPPAQEGPGQAASEQPPAQPVLLDFSFVNSAVDIGTQLSDLQREERRLREAHRAHRGQSDAPTSEMYAECQELLQMFGIPYIIAPMEAESQCAWMDEMGLVDGVVTDDNDVFLFGGQRIYRNIFQSNKYVEEFHFKDIERELGLTREKLTHLALLLGSDYTPGIAGVGIVNAVEVVNSFPTFDDLKLFKKWVDSPADDLLELLQVIEAYLNPKFDAARDNECFDWATDKADELLLPVLSAYDARQAQLTIDSFLSHRERFAKIKSKRLQKALGSIKPGLDKDILFEQAIQERDDEASKKAKPAAGKGKRGKKK
ncbi:hypothetical protein N2152v2_001569 [Parachlorella kessleri]